MGEYEPRPFSPVVDITKPFLLPPIPPGTGEVELHVAGCEPVRRRFAAEAGKVTRLELSLRKRP